MSPLQVFDLKFSGHHIVEAAAGTGKTYSITSLYVRALVEKQLLPSQILVLTFTNDATAELKFRLRQRIQALIKHIETGKSEEEFIVQYSKQISQEQFLHLKKCLYYFDEAAISTIHGFCQRILSEYHVEFNVSSNFILETDIVPLKREAVDEFWDEFFFRSNPSTEYKKWLSTQLNLEFQSPDKLLTTLEPLITNQDIRIDSEPVSFDNFEELFDSTNELFKQIRIYYEAEKDSFFQFYDSEALKGTYYRNKQKILSDFEDWLYQNNQSPSVYDKLHLFGVNVSTTYTKKDYEAPKLALFDIVQQYIDTRNQLSNIEYVFKRIAAQEIRKNIEKTKKSRGLVGYKDLLVLVNNGLSKSKEICSKLAKRFPIAFIDEFQDTDHLQYSIFNSIYFNKNISCLIMIGDPKQAIYRFRGADIQTYLAAKSRTPERNKYSLSFNYRSSRALIEVVNGIFSGVVNPFKKDGIIFEPAKFPEQRNDIHISSNTGPIAPFNLIHFENDDRLAADIRSEIAKSVATECVGLLQRDLKIDQKPVQANDIAILVDTHRNAELVQDTLLEYGLRSIIRSKASVFKSEESDQLFKILYAIAHPLSEGYLKSSLLTDFFDYRASDILAFDQDEERWQNHHSMFLNLNTQWGESGLKVVFRLLENELEVLKNIAQNVNPERSITNYKHLKELLLHAERNNSLSIFGLIRYFSSKRKEEVYNAPDEEVIRLESDDDLIQIVTHHASKGLEYNIVFCPFLWNFSIKTPLIPIKSDGLSQSGFIDGNSKVFLEARDENKIEDEAEKVRLVYVALTRAKAMCYIYYNNGIKLKGKSGFNAIDYLMANNKDFQNLIKNKVLVHSKRIEFHKLKFQSKEITLDRAFETAELNRKDLNNFERFYSFSSISSHHSPDINDFDFGYDYDEDLNTVLTEDVQDIDIFSLPKGKNTGNLVHAIFERIDFTDPSTIEAVVEEQMQNVGYDTKWRSCIIGLVNSVLSHFLVEDVTLSKIKNSDRLVEMEFNFPINNLDANKLFDTIGLANNSNTSIIKGFMKGFVDLIFRKDGRYYILDYKSNHLGDSYSSYKREELTHEMRNSNYILQYHIYLIAFLRFIKIRKPDFDYEREFGGVIYLFLRGVNADEAESGVYFHRPDLEVIHRFDELMGSSN